MSAYDQLIKSLDALDITVDRYGTEIREAAAAEAEYKSARARRILRARADGARSVSEAESQSDADDTIAGLLMRRLTTAAIAEASKQQLFAIRERIGGLRTYLADQRAADQQHATGERT